MVTISVMVIGIVLIRTPQMSLFPDFFFFCRNTRFCPRGSAPSNGNLQQK